MRDNNTLKERLKINFPFHKPLSERQQTNNGSLFGYVQCDLSVPKHLQSYFPPVFKNIFVSKSDIGENVNSYADQKGLLQQGFLVFTWKMGVLKLRFSFSTGDWVLSLQGFADLLFTLLKNVSKDSINQ